MDKREQILSAALTLFTERGFHSTPTSLIAKTAGVAVGTLFHHFESKEELINEVYIAIKQKLAEALSSDVEKLGSVEEQLKQLWMNGVRWGMKNHDQYRFFQQFSNSPFITSLTREQAMASFEFQITLFREAIDQGLFVDMHEEFIHDYLAGAMMMTISHFLTFPDKANDEVLEQVYNIFRKGITQ